MDCKEDFTVDRDPGRYVHAHVYVHTRTYSYSHKYTHVQDTHVYTRAHTYTFSHVRTLTHTRTGHAYVYTRAHTRTYIHTPISIDDATHVCHTSTEPDPTWSLQGCFRARRIGPGPYRTSGCSPLTGWPYRLCRAETETRVGSHQFHGNPRGSK